MLGPRQAVENGDRQAEAGRDRRRRRERAAGGARRRADVGPVPHLPASPPRQRRGGGREHVLDRADDGRSDGLGEQPRPERCAGAIRRCLPRRSGRSRTTCPMLSLPRRFSLSLMAAFALAALALPVTGSHAVGAYSVGQRAHEFAIRSRPAPDGSISCGSSCGKARRSRSPEPCRACSSAWSRSLRQRSRWCRGAFSSWPWRHASVRGFGPREPR